MKKYYFLFIFSYLFAIFVIPHANAMNNTKKKENEYANQYGEVLTTFMNNEDNNNTNADETGNLGSDFTLCPMTRMDKQVFSALIRKIKKKNKFNA